MPLPGTALSSWMRAGSVPRDNESQTLIDGILRTTRFFCDFSTLFRERKPRLETFWQDQTNVCIPVQLGSVVLCLLIATYAAGEDDGRRSRAPSELVVLSVQRASTSRTPVAVRPRRFFSLARVKRFRRRDTFRSTRTPVSSVWV